MWWYSIIDKCHNDIDGSVLPLFLGSIIYNKRREMNLTQIELANDICTQNTISKIEKHNTAPTVNILIKICTRLDLTLNDVFSDFSGKSSANEESLLDVIERDVLLKNIEGIDTKLSELEGKLTNNDKKQYELITGVMDYWNNNYDASLFTMDKVLQLTKSNKSDIYTFLSDLFKGLNYLGQGHTDRAQYYFQMIVDSVDSDSKVTNANDLEILFICKTLANSFNEMRLHDQSYRISRWGLNYACEKHVSYFLDELNYAAAIAVENNADKEQEYQDYSNLAYYLAKAGNNQALLNVIGTK